TAMILSFSAIYRITTMATGSSILDSLLLALREKCATSRRLIESPLSADNRGGERVELPRYLFSGPGGGGDPIRIGIFAGIHGDEPAGAQAVLSLLDLLQTDHNLGEGYHLFFYPVCNPSGFADGTRCSRTGKDLNREFWKNSDEIEVCLLEQEIRA